MQGNLFRYENFLFSVLNLNSVLDIPKAATLGSEFRTGAFTFAEQVKSQLVPVTKYESTVLIVPPMHAILFTNTPIPEGAFAEDRVHLITLTKAADVWNWTTKII